MHAHLGEASQLLVRVVHVEQHLERHLSHAAVHPLQHLAIRSQDPLLIGRRHDTSACHLQSQHPATGTFRHCRQQILSPPDTVATSICA